MATKIEKDCIYPQVVHSFGRKKIKTFKKYYSCFYTPIYSSKKRPASEAGHIKLFGF